MAKVNQSHNCVYVILLVFYATSCLAAPSSFCEVEVKKKCGEEPCECVEKNGKIECKTCDIMCPEIEKLECLHGKCTPKGCQCEPCWAGETCSMPQNPHAPVFTQDQYLVDVLNTDEAQLITLVSAADSDSKVCGNCSCAKIYYAIESGNSDGAFTIVPGTGDIRFYSKSGDTKEHYNLTISAKNIPDRKSKLFSGLSWQPSYSRLIVNVKSPSEKPSPINAKVSQPYSKQNGGLKDEKVIDNAILNDVAKEAYDELSSLAAGRRLLNVEDEDLSVHSRHKRAAGNPASFPDNVTILLEKSGNWANVNQIKVGDKIPMKLTINVPEGTTDIKVEVYTSENNGAILSICPFTVTSIGSNFHSLQPGDVNAVLTSKYNDWKYDRAVLNFGTVINNGTDAADNTSNEIVVTFHVVVVNNPRFTTGELYSVNTGVLYENGAKVWVSEASFEGITDNAMSGNTPATFLLTGPSDLFKGEVGVWKLDMSIYDLANNVTVDVFAPLNTTAVMSICRISVEETGESYECLTRGRDDSLSFIREPGNDALNSVATLDLGEIINTGFRSGDTDPSKNTITLEISATMMNSSDVVIGEQYSLGVSVQIDSHQIWTCQVAVTAVEEQLSNFTVVPQFSLEAASEELVVGGHTAFLLNMSLPQNTTNRYTLEVALPYNDTVLMSGCRVRVRYQGFNYPFLNLPPVQYVSEDDSEEYNEIFLNMGLITNTGQRESDADNTLQIEIAVAILNKTVITQFDSLKVVVGVRFGDSYIYVAQESLTVLEAPPDYGDSKVPEISLTNKMSDRYIYNQSSVVYHVEMFFPTASYHSPVDMEIDIPVIDDKPVVHICSVKTLHVGINFACTNSTEVDDSIMVYGNSAHNDVHNKATMHIGMLSNVGKDYYPVWREESVIRLEVVVSYVEHDNFTSNETDAENNADYWPSMSVKYAKDKIYVCTSSLSYSDADPEISNATAGPIVNMTAVDSDITYPGGLVEFELDIALPPASTANYFVESITANDTVSICRVEYKSKGPSIPCGDTPVTTNPTDLITEIGDNHTSLAQMSMIGVTSTETDELTLDNKDKSTVSVQVIARIQEDIDVSQYGNLSGQYMVTSVSTGLRRLWLDHQALRLNVNDRPQMVQNPVVQFVDSPAFIVPGESAVYTIEVYIPPGTFGHYALNLMAPWNSSDAGMAGICDIRIIDAGYNLPCVNDSYADRNFSLNFPNDYRDYDTATLDMGVIASSNRNNDSSWMSNKDDRVRVQAVVSVPAAHTDAAGQTINVAAALQIDSTKIWVGYVTFTIGVRETHLTANKTQGNVTVQTIQPNDTDNRIADITNENTVAMKIRQRRWWTFRVTLDPVMGNDGIYIPMAMPMTLAINTPITDCGSDGFFEARATVHGFRFENTSGQNIGCIDAKPEPVFTSSQNPTTSQMDTMDVDLGIITNTGSSLNQPQKWYRRQDDDNIFEFSIELELTDHPNNTHLSEFTFDMTLTYGDNVVFTVSPNITVITPDDKEEEDIVYKVWHNANETADPYSVVPGSEVTFYAILYHTENSTRELRNLTLIIQLPYFTQVISDSIKFNGTAMSEVGSTNGLSENAVILQPEFYSNTKGFVLRVPTFLFYDMLDISFKIVLDPFGLVPLGTRMNTFIASEDLTFYTRLHATDSEGVFDQDIYAQAPSDVVFEFYVQDCYNNMQIGNLDSCQIQASSGDSTEVFINSATAWTNKWRGPPFYQNEYLQLNFGNKTRVTGILLASDALDNTSYVTVFTLQHSMDGLSWTDVLDEETFEVKLHNTSFNESDVSVSNIGIPLEVSTDDVMFVPIYPAFEAKYVRIRPYENSKNSYQSSLRAEAYGCSKENGMTKQDIPECSASALSELAYSERSYLVEPNTGEIFVCMITEIDGDVRCSVSKDSGASWTRLSSNVWDIRFHSNKTGGVYAVSRNKRGMLRSVDLGMTWTAVCDEEINEVENLADTTNAMTITFDDFTQSTVYELFVSFGMVYKTSAYYGVSEYGLHKWDSEAAINTTSDAALPNSAQRKTELESVMIGSWWEK